MGKRRLGLMVAAALIALTAGVALAADGLAAAAPAPAPSRHVDLCICLDTSNSMDGLIDAARMKLWDIVNTLAVAKPRPAFRVAIYEYGNTRLTSESGWVRQVIGLSDDLDTVYKELMALKTSGGTEYVGRVVDRATRDLDWSKDRDALKIIYVAGNEPATQDPKVKSVEAASKAIAAGIIVNTIHCGDHATGINTGWQAVAQAADGQYASINQNETFAVATPVDAKLLELNRQLNGTYIAYGARGAEGQANQAAQDRAAEKLSAPAAAQRAVAKSGALYKNAGWDLVDASKDKDFKLEEVKDDQLPENMRKMTPEQRKAYVEEMAKKRSAIQAEIARLAAEQRAFIDKARKERSSQSAKSLDTVLLKSLTEQAEKKGFTFEQPKAPERPDTPPAEQQPADPASAQQTGN